MAPHHRSARTLRGAMLVTAALLLSACSITNPFGATAMGPPLPQLAHDAVTAYQTAPSVQVRGSYQVGSAPVTVQLSMEPSSTGAISGRGSYRGLPLDVVGSSGRTFTSGYQYWQAQGAGGLKIWSGFGKGWVLAPTNDPGADAISDSRDLGGLVAQLGRQASNLRSQGTSEFDGTQIASLSDGLTTYDVTTSQPYRLVAVRRGGSTPSSGGLSGINLQVRYGGTLQVSLPATGQFVDPHNAATFPALFEVQTSALGTCDASSCAMTATLVNTAGQEQGVIVATLAIYSDAQFTTLLGSCSAPVPQVATGQTTPVSCSITNQAYQSFFSTLTATTPVYRRVTLQNPPYSS